MTEYVLIGLVAVLLAERHKERIAAAVKKLVPKKDDNNLRRIEAIVSQYGSTTNAQYSNLKAELDHIKGAQQDLSQKLLAFQSNIRLDDNSEVYMKSLELLTKASGTIIERQAAIEQKLVLLVKELTNKE